MKTIPAKPEKSSDLLSNLSTDEVRRRMEKICDLSDIFHEHRRRLEDDRAALIAALSDMVSQHCGVGADLVKTDGLSANETALELLRKYRKVEKINDGLYTFHVAPLIKERET
jgi:hypothetical protein